jgi:hypothetical protein
MDVQQEIHERLAPLLPKARKAFAVACAERLMGAYERAPEATGRSSIASWRAVLDAIWNSLTDESDERGLAVKRALRAVEEDDAEESDVDAEAASAYAAECYKHGRVEAAFHALTREIESAFEIAVEELELDPNDFVWDPSADPPMPLARESMHAAVQQTLSRQLMDLEQLERDGVTAAVVQRFEGSEARLDRRGSHWAVERR